MQDSAEDQEGSALKTAAVAAAVEHGDGVGAGGGGRRGARDAGDMATIPASEITLCLDSDGRPLCLGEGAFGTVSCSPALCSIGVAIRACGRASFGEGAFGTVTWSPCVAAVRPAVPAVGCVPPPQTYHHEVRTVIFFSENGHVVPCGAGS